MKQIILNFLLVITLFWVELTNAQCPRSYTRFNDRFCYKVSGRFLTRRRNWESANRQCRAEGGSLMQVQSPSDVDRIREVIVQLRNRGFRSGSAYIGITDIGDGKGFMNADKTIIVRENWSGSKPKIQTAGRRLCGSVSFLDPQGRWRAGTCVFPQMFICAYIPLNIRKQFIPVKRVRCHQCTNARSNTECNRGGLKLCPIGQDSCQNEVRVVGGGKKMITKRCKQNLACENNFVQNNKAAWVPAQCDPSRQFNSVCRCCCKGDGCNANELPCLDSGCPTLPVDTNTQIKCSNSYMIGSTCTISCEAGYEIRGPDKVSCIGSTPRWSRAIPQCKRVRCLPEVKAITNGAVTCSDTNRMFSSCTFNCKQGFFLTGLTTITCSSTGAWSGVKPTCKLIQCKVKVAPPANGSITKRTLPLLNAEMKFGCNEKHFLHGSDTITCSDNDRDGEGEWNNPPPKCTSITCPTSIKAPANGGVTFSDRNVIGSMGTFSCGEGYFLTGSKSISCIGPLPTGKGKWSEQPPTCEAITCPKLQQPSNSKVTVDEDSLTFNTVAQFSCDFGYFLVGSKTTSCTDANGDGVGDWTATPPECQQIFCSALVAPDNGLFESMVENTLAKSVKFACNEGFTMKGVDEVTCLDTNGDGKGEWSNAVPICEQILCEPKLQIPTNGDKLCSEDTRYGSTCLFKCTFGYFLDGSDSSLCEDNDGDGVGSWSESSPTCIEITCSPPHVLPSNGDVTCSKTNKLTSACRFTCDEGYWLTGRVRSVCEAVEGQADGKWTNDPPTCEEIHCPEKQESPQFGSVSCTEETRYGAECSFSCPIGFFLFGEDFLTCGDTNVDGIGEWDEDPPYCSAVICTPMLKKPENGEISCNDSMEFFSECSFSCHPGYELSGERTSQCGNPVDNNAHGTWSQEEPTCIPKQCSPSESPTNGIVSCDDADMLFSSCTYSCKNERYFLNGNDSRQCRPVNDDPEAEVGWTIEEPICELINCPMLENDFQFTRLNILCTANRAYESNCMFECEPGFNIDGPDDISCGKPTEGNVGTWSDFMPVCLKSDCNIGASDPVNGTVDCTDGDRYESVCIYSCYPGYQLAGAKTRNCMADGSWDVAPPICERMTCMPEYKTPENGVMFCTEENKFGSYCNFDCDLGYRLVGSDEAMCGVDINGDGYGDYTQPKPTCSPIFCPVISNGITGGKIVCSNPEFESANRYDSTCLLVCDDGWKVIGESRTICRGEGKWTTRLGICQRIKCIPPLGSIPRGRVICSLGNDYPGQECRFSCSSSRFILVGTESLTCQNDGKWSGAVPRCEQRATK